MYLLTGPALSKIMNSRTDGVERLFLLEMLFPVTTTLVPHANLI
ncbi:MAG: hypothetical protein O2955_04235 [Planctomycetota bacterium]|nr:hypothetical protein [Planctomycetota bacterium]